MTNINGDTLSLSSLCCSARLFLSFALHLANLYKVPLPECEGDGKDLLALLVFLITFSVLSPSHSLLHQALLPSTSLYILLTIINMPCVSNVLWTARFLFTFAHIMC